MPESVYQLVYLKFADAHGINVKCLKQEGKLGNFTSLKSRQFMIR